MLRRIFLAVNLPQEAKAQLLAIEQQLGELPARWTKPENLHVTLVFLGNTSEQELGAVKRIASEVAQKYKPFSFSFEKIGYGPTPKQPRMIWVSGKASSELLSLQKDLEQSLGNSPDLSFKSQNRPFSLHLTLARLNEWEFRKMEPEEQPEISEDIDLQIPVSSFEIMESKLKRTGAEYSVIENFPLQLDSI